LKGQNLKDIFATEITEAIEGLKFKAKRKRLTPEESVLRAQV
jgi:hypothetical protein